MSKKDRMLSIITNKVNWFMTKSSFEVIPYNELPQSVFNRVKEYFASDAKYEDIVCLISTSILETGKCGVLFTTNSVYSKAWGGVLTGIYKNRISAPSNAEFDTINEFDTERMRKIITDLATIIEEEKKEEEKKEKERIRNNVIKVASVATVGAMLFADIISSIGDTIVDKNNEAIADEIASLDDSINAETGKSMGIYEEFFSPVNELFEILIENQNVGEIDEDIRIEFFQIMRYILIELYNQTIDMENISIDDVDEYTKFNEWTVFWALILSEPDQFRDKYPLDSLQNMPEYWQYIVSFVDTIVEDKGWESSFSDIIFIFSNTIINNSIGIEELLSDSEWDDEFIETMRILTKSNIIAVSKLADALDRVIDYFSEFVPEEEEE